VRDSANTAPIGITTAPRCHTTHRSAINHPALDHFPNRNRSEPDRNTRTAVTPSSAKAMSTDTSHRAIGPFCIAATDTTTSRAAGVDEDRRPPLPLIASPPKRNTLNRTLCHPLSPPVATAQPVWQNWRMAHLGWTKVARLALALLAATPLAATSSATAAETGLSVLPANTVTRLATAPEGVTLPADPRLNDYEVSGQILGVARGRAAGTDVAAKGQQLWAFGLAWTTNPARKSGTVGMTVTFQAATVDLPVTLPASADPPGGGTSPSMWFVASVPTASGSNATVTLTVGSYPQTFDLSTMSRRAPVPVALYRSSTSWRGFQAEDVTQTLPSPDPQETGDPALPTATIPIHLAGVTLSWFPPSGPPDVPADPTQAWLSVDLTSQTSDNTRGANTYLNYGTPMPASGLTLTIPGQAPVTAIDTPGGGSDVSGVGIFTDRYAFSVPATFTTGTLAVTPGIVKAEPDLDLGYPDTVTIQGTASFPLALPQTPPPSPAAGASHPGALVAAPTTTVPATGAPTTTPPSAATSPVTDHQATGATHGTAPSSSSHTALIVAVAAPAVLLVLLAVLFGRRRFTLPRTAAAGTSSAGPAVDHPAPRWQAHPPPPPANASPPPRSGAPQPESFLGRSSNGPIATTWPAASPPPPPSAATPDGPDGPSWPLTERPASSPVARPPAPASPISDNLTGLATSFARRPWQPPPPPALPEGLVEIGILGPIRLDYHGTPVLLRPAVIELAAFLALHPEHGWTADALNAAVSVNAERFKTDTVRNYLVSLRRALGSDHVPEGGATGYTLVAVTTDWQRFERVAHSGDPTSSTAALTLVRGAPFAGVEVGTWGWVDRKSHASLRAEIDRTVTDLAVRVAETAIATGDIDLAMWATEQGLQVIPDSDRLLHLTLEAAALNRPNPERLDQAWTAIIRHLQAVDDMPGPELTATYHRLRRPDG
jgi:hypothetical protein